MLEQRFQRLLPLIAEGIVERLCRQPAGAGAAGQTDAIQRVRARQHEPLRLYLTAQAGQDDAPVVGVERRPGSQVRRNRAAFDGRSSSERSPNGDAWRRCW